MTFRTELARMIAGKQPEQPATPKTRGAASGTDKNPYARLGRDGKGDRRESIRRFMKNYKRGGLYADMIDSYPLFTLASGYSFMCEEGAEDLKEKVIAWCDQEHVDLDAIMYQGILSAKLAGDAYQEIVPTAKGEGVYTVLTRDPSQFDKVTGKLGVESYVQHVPKATGYGEDEIPIPYDDMINLMIDCIPGDVYGQSVWDRAEDDIDGDCDVIESIRAGIHRYGTPHHTWQIGSEENRANASDIKDFSKEVEEMNAKTDFVVTHDTNPVMMDTTGVPNVDVYSNISLQRTSCALGVPEEMAGLGRGSTEATATVRLDTFMKRIKAMQGIVARTYSRKLIDRITGVPGAVWIEFNENKIEDFLKLADAISKLRAGFDPEAVCPAPWARERLGIPPDEEPKE
jgi:hypothetical protein